MASYVEEELKHVQDELLSSEEVLSKVKLEMQKAMPSGDPFRTEAIIVNTIKWNALEFQIIQLICCIPILKFRACIPSSKNNVEFFPPLISYNPSTPGF